MNESHARRISSTWPLPSVAMVGAVAGFAFLFSFAACAYPGGTHFDHQAMGHDFWRNTLCDVARTVALDGAPNPVGCAFARAAMILLALGLGVLFVSLPRFFAGRERLGRAVRLLGTASVPFAIAVVLLPTDRFGELHGLAIVVAGTLGLAAAVLALVGLFTGRSPRSVRYLGAAALVVALVDFALYVRELTGACGAQVAVAVLERLATLLILAWMLAVSAALRSANDIRRARAREVS